MSFAPQHDWVRYEAAVRSADREHLRNMSSDQRFSLYADLHRFACSGQKDPVQQQRLDDYCWKEKLRLRQKMLKAFGY